jgi:hypothetical protein
MKNMGGTTFLVIALIFAASAVVFGATVVDAIRVGEVPASTETGLEATPQSAQGDEEHRSPEEGLVPEGGVDMDARVRYAAALERPLPGPAYPRVTDDELLEAVNQDVFQPDRTPPLERYLFPGEREVPGRGSQDNRRRRNPNLRIVGTAIAGDLALAMVQPDDSIPFAVLLGEEVDGYLLAAIDEESVTLTRDGDEFVYPVREPQRGRTSSDRGRNARNRASTEEAARALTERVQQMLQGMRWGQGVRGEAMELQPNVFFRTPEGVIIRGGETNVARPVTIRLRNPRGGGSGGGGLP